MVSGMLVLVVNSKMGLAMVVELIEMFCSVHLYANVYILGSFW